MNRAARAPEQAPSADLRVQARALEKAPPAFSVENVAKIFGTPVTADKSESPKPAQIHPATLVGHAPSAGLAPHRAPSFEGSARASGPRRRARAAGRARTSTKPRRVAAHPRPRPTWPKRSPRALRTPTVCRPRAAPLAPRCHVPGSVRRDPGRASAARADPGRAKRTAGARRRGPVAARDGDARARRALDRHRQRRRARAAPAGQGRRRRRARRRRRRPHRRDAPVGAARRAGERGADARQLPVGPIRARAQPRPRAHRRRRRLAPGASLPAPPPAPPTIPQPPRSQPAAAFTSPPERSLSHASRDTRIQPVDAGEPTDDRRCHWTRVRSAKTTS